MTSDALPQPGDVAAAFSWRLEEAPDASSASLDNATGGTTSLDLDVRGIYELTLRADIADSLTGIPDDGSEGTFRQENTLRFVAADSLVETFESGVLEAEGPFLWRTGDGLGAPWFVTNDLSHTGSFSVRSGEIPDNASSTLQARFDQVGPGSLSFSFRLLTHFSDSLIFAVDDVVHGRWNGADPWTEVVVDLEAGLHTASWTYKKDDADTFGADRVWIDDVFFPTSALFTGIEEANDNSDVADPDTDDGEDPDASGSLRLSRNFPNPFAEETIISFEIPRPTEVELAVFDALGREVAVLASGVHSGGAHSVTFNAASLANGVYHYQLRVGDDVLRRTMVLLR